MPSAVFTPDYPEHLAVHLLPYGFLSGNGLPDGRLFAVIAWYPLL
jgi:hypothetical protein